MPGKSQTALFSFPEDLSNALMAGTVAMSPIVKLPVCTREEVVTLPSRNSIHLTSLLGALTPACLQAQTVVRLSLAGAGKTYAPQTKSKQQEGRLGMGALSGCDNLHVRLFT